MIEVKRYDFPLNAPCFFFFKYKMCQIPLLLFVIRNKIRLYFILIYSKLLRCFLTNVRNNEIRYMIWIRRYICCCIVDRHCCCVADRHCFFPARLWYVLHVLYVLYVSHKLISSRSPCLSVTDTICLHFHFSVSRPGMEGI